MTDFYTVMFNGENLYEYKMIEQEVIKVEGFMKELIDVCNDLEIPRGKSFDGSPYMGRLKDDYDFVIKYKEDIGYFVLDGERGKFYLREGFPTKDRNEAKLFILESEFFNGGLEYELGIRNTLKEEWINKYSVEYDSRNKAFEYTIRMLIKVFESVPDRIIIYYTNYMNKWFDTPHWYFDKSELSFKEL